MTQLTLQRQALPRESGAARNGVTTATRWSLLGGWFREKLPSLAWWLPISVVSLVVHAVNLGGLPQRIDDEGTYVAQAFAIQNFGELAHYTYWYDHPPLGWIQIAAWTSLTGAFERNDVAVMAGRELMLVALVASLALLWMLARRLDFSRPAAAAVLVVFGLSPLAVQFHRTVFLDNIATPWLLAAFVLVLHRNKQLAAFVAAAVCFAVAVLTKETYLLFGPFLAWMVWRNADRGTRRYTVSVAAGLVVLLGMGYVLLAAINGELMPGEDRVSLWEGITFQLATRDASGSVFDAGSQAAVTASQWIQLDPLLVAVAPVAAVVALLDRKLRPLAAALVFLLVFMLRPGYLPVPYVIALLPLAALVVVGSVQLVLRWAGRRRHAVTRTGGRVLGAALSIALVVGVAPLWGPQLRGLLLADLDLPMRQTQAWVEANVDRDYRLVVDDAMWVDLYRAGFEREDVVWYYKVDTDPEVAALAPNGWQDYDYVITTDSMRTSLDGFPIVSEALANSTVVAEFGTGNEELQVHRVEAQGAEAAEAQGALDASARVETGTELASNPGLDTPGPTSDLLTGGRVDARAIIGTALAATLGDVTVADYPAVDGEESLQRPRRQLLLTELDGRSLAGDRAAADSVVSLLTAQSPVYAPRSTQLTDDGLLVTWNVDRPSGLLGAG